MATPSRSADRIDVVESVVLVRGVSHLYGSTHALDGLDIEVPSGCMVGLIGPDGVGKSTLMGLIAGSKRIQTGEVRVLGGPKGPCRPRRLHRSFAAKPAIQVDRLLSGRTRAIT